MTTGILLRSVHITPKYKPTGRTHHYFGLPLPDGTEVRREEIPAPSALQIVKSSEVGDESFYLLYLDEAGRELTDTWHRTLEDALYQAQMEFGVPPDAWEILG